MKISKLIKKLEALQEKHGDVSIIVDNFKGSTDELELDNIHPIKSNDEVVALMLSTEVYDKTELENVTNEVILKVLKGGNENE